MSECKNIKFLAFTSNIKYKIMSNFKYQIQLSDIKFFNIYIYSFSPVTFMNYEIISYNLHHI